jgi:hypothetical protein
MRRATFDDLEWGLNFLRPKPSPFAFERIGGEGDGAYLVPADLDGVRACFSPGVSNRKDFEDELADRYGIQSFLCDYSSDVSQFATPLKEGLQHFDKKWLDIDGSPDSVSLAGWVNQYSPDSSQDLLLQMDIEGAEYRNLQDAPTQLMRRFRIIVLELHDVFEMLDGRFEQRIKPLLLKLDETHVVIHIHPNNASGERFVDGTEINLSNVLELTLLRRDRFSPKQLWQLKFPQVPHPLDIGRNVDEHPPVFMSEWWTHNQRDEASKVKLLSDSEAFYRHAYWNLLNSSTDLSTARWLLRLVTATASDEDSEHNPAQDLVRHELAQGRPFRLSSVHSANIGLDQVEARTPFFFHTDKPKSDSQAMSSITIDLGCESRVDSIFVTNRQDACQSRARFLMYCVHLSELCTYREARPLDLTADFLAGSSIGCATSVPSLVGRFITVFIPEPTSLHLADIQVYGSPT